VKAATSSRFHEAGSGKMIERFADRRGAGTGYSGKFSRLEPGAGPKAALHDEAPQGILHSFGSVAGIHGASQSCAAANAASILG